MKTILDRGQYISVSWHHVGFVWAVGNKLTYRENSIILQPCHVEVFDHAFNFSIADICTIDMANHVQNCEHGD